MHTDASVTSFVTRSGYFAPALLKQMRGRMRSRQTIRGSTAPLTFNEIGLLWPELLDIVAQRYRDPTLESMLKCMGHIGRSFRFEGRTRNTFPFEFWRGAKVNHAIPDGAVIA